MPLALASSCWRSWASKWVLNQAEKRQMTEAWVRKGTTGSSGPLLTRTLIGLLVKLEVGGLLVIVEKRERGRAHWSSRW